VLEYYRVADGKRQAVWSGANDAGLVNHLQLGGVRAAGQVAGQVGDAHADKDLVSVL